MVSRYLTYSSPYSPPHLEVENAFHALSLDDLREAFSPTLWFIPPEQGNISPTRRTQLKQCWFAGVHTDVGRGYDDHVPGDIADITFAWMVDQCRHLLAFNEEKVLSMLDKGDFKEPVGEWARRERARREFKAKTWGLADLHASRPADPVDLMYRLSGTKARTPGQYVFKAQESGSSPSGRDFVTESKILPRRIGSGAFAGSPKGISKFDPVWTSEVIHPSVRVRLTQDPMYNPPALKDFKLRYDEANSRWTWTKEWTDANGEIRETTMHEDSIENCEFSMRKAGPDILEFKAHKNKDPIRRKGTRLWQF